MTLYTPEDLAPGYAAHREAVLARMRVLLNGPCGREVFAVLLALAVRNPWAELTKGEVVERTAFAEATVRKALERATLAELVTVTRRRQPDRHRYYRLTEQGVEFARQLVARQALAAAPPPPPPNDPE